MRRPVLFDARAPGQAGHICRFAACLSDAFTFVAAHLCTRTVFVTNYGTNAGVVETAASKACAVATARAAGSGGVAATILSDTSSGLGAVLRSGASKVRKRHADLVHHVAGTTLAASNRLLAVGVGARRTHGLIPIAFYEAAFTQECAGFGEQAIDGGCADAAITVRILGAFSVVLAIERCGAIAVVARTTIGSQVFAFAFKDTVFGLFAVPIIFRNTAIVRVVATFSFFGAYLSGGAMLC
jgi:hypothetical protein